MLTLYKAVDIVMLFGLREIIATQLNCQKFDSGYRQLRKPDLKWRTNVSCLVNVGYKERIAPKRFGLTCAIKELSERHQRVVPNWRDGGQTHSIQYQPPLIWRDNLIVRKQASAINQIVGLTSKSKRIIEERNTGFYAELSHRHSNKWKNIEVSKHGKPDLVARYDITLYHLNNTHKKETMITPL